MNDDSNVLLSNLEKIHTTELGVQRIKRNLGLQTTSISDWCRMCVADNKSKISRQGKNWYVTTESCVITINRTSFTIITAHKRK